MFLLLYSNKEQISLPPIFLQHDLKFPSVFKGPDKIGTYSKADFKVLEHRLAKSVHKKDIKIPFICPKSSVVIIFWGRLDNKTELAHLLSEYNIDNQSTNSEIILAAWEKWGEKFPKKIIGDFAIVVNDPIKKVLFIVRDPLGIKPIYISEQNGVVAVASTVSALRTIPALKFTPDPEWMAKYLIGQSFSKQSTGYVEIKKMLPGHTITYQKNSTSQLKAYHKWENNAPWGRKREQIWVERYKKILEESILCRMGSKYPIGTENSGGIDSATITAYLAKKLGQPGDNLHSFGFAMQKDEPAYILETSQKCNVRHNHIISGMAYSKNQKIFDNTLAVLGYPDEHGNGAHHIPFYQECKKHNIQTLFSGFGGDEVVTNPAHLLRPELVDQRAYLQLWKILPGNIFTRLMRFGHALTFGRKPKNYRTTFLKTFKERWLQSLLSSRIVDKYDLQNEFFESAVYDAPYRNINRFIIEGLLNKPYIQTRFENCTLMAASYGVEYSWPLWDIRLVQQYLSTPNIEKFGPKGIGRYLHRRAIDGVVPKRVAWKQNKHMGGKVHNTDNSLDQISFDYDDLLFNLAPELSDLINNEKLKNTLQAIKDGKIKPNQKAHQFTFRQIHNLNKLNHWLATK
jgi:asparagine synthase (glutamine-hydrolysing)